jgi:hypothetical protein
MTERWEQAWNTLVSLDSETLLRVITDYHGMQLLDDGFAEFLVDEGLMEQVDEEVDEEADDEEAEEQKEPGDDDYIISDCGPLGSRTVVCVYKAGGRIKGNTNSLTRKKKRSRQLKRT